MQQFPSVIFVDTPTLTLKAKGAKAKSHRMMDAAECVNILMRELGRNANVVIALEKVSAAPIEGRRQGTSSMFSFGMGFGIWIGILAGLQLPYTLVHPATWKASLMRDQAKEKSASILRAKQLYPQAAPCLNLVKHHGRADALLLAHYARLNLSLGQVAPNIELAEVKAPLFEPAF
jgi:crossover junction endodeoxyribonuclease RuvC